MNQLYRKFTERSTPLRVYINVGVYILNREKMGFLEVFEIEKRKYDTSKHVSVTNNGFYIITLDAYVHYSISEIY